jgi:putative OPT family oligopeptide transporter
MDQQTPTSPETPGGHQPYVADSDRRAEFTWPAVVVGAVLGIIFGASSLYLVLKVGMTVSASIPVAVLSITLFRLFSRVFGVRRATILENNIVQTTGSAGESIAFGVGVTMPALMLLGFEMTIGKVMVVSILGGALGILMMIPLRRAFIVKKHGELKYPEGTACADVLIVGEQGGSSAKTVFVGFGMALVYQFLMQGLKFWKEVVGQPLRWFQGATPAIEVSPVLLGVGYIIGTRISCLMVGGGILASFVLVPVIRFFGQGLTHPLAPGTELISRMSVDDITHDYVLFVGAGAVAAGGIISLFQALPLILSSIAAGLRDIGVMTAAADGGNGSARRRTDRDMPLTVVFFGSLLLVLAIWLLTPLEGIFSWVNLAAAVLIVLFGFLFVTVSSRLTGEIGSSSNPISGMTVATLLLTCLIFLVLGWTDVSHRFLALSVAAIVCVAASNGGTTSQDLKTGYLIGATPIYQQWAILIGSISSALVIGYVLILLNQASTVYTAKNLPPQKQAVDISKLTTEEQSPEDGQRYRVWQAPEGNAAGVPEAKYLVDSRGQIRYLVDPGINGKYKRRDNGTEVTKYSAPKAVLMAIITKGILKQDLPWTLVLLGVAIAIVLELSGVPSLPFAVGVYLPLSSSTPIFVGGLARYVADRWAARRGNAPRSETESDMSPGVLLSTGYIAGGAIGGVIIAMLSFSDTIPVRLAAWQYRRVTVAAETPLPRLYRETALRELGLQRVAKPGPAEEDRIADFVNEMTEINAQQLPSYVRVRRATVLKLPGDKTYAVRADTTLGEIAEQVLRSADKAGLLLDLNSPPLHAPESLPAGAVLRVPQKDWPALAVFGGLSLVLALVGVGLLMRAPAIIKDS